MSLVPTGFPQSLEVLMCTVYVVCTAFVVESAYTLSTCISYTIKINGVCRLAGIGKQTSCARCLSTAVLGNSISNKVI